MAIFRFGKVYSSNYFCSDGKLLGFDAATKVNTQPLAVTIPPQKFYKKKELFLSMALPLQN
jgi:hypothetical protein